MSEQKQIRIGVLTGDDLVREGLEALIDRTDDLTFAGGWGDYESAVEALPHVNPDVLILDVKLPQGSAFKMLRSLPKVSARTKALVTVECLEEGCFVLSPGVLGGIFRSRSGPVHELPSPDDCLQLALKTGAHGVIRRQCSFSKLAEAIREVDAGRTVLEHNTAQRLAEQYLVSFHHHDPELETGAESLTLRERQIVQLISQGRSNKEISREMQLAYSTVKNYVSSILEKLKLQDRTQIALYAVAANGK